jgi:hypothetical protein
MKEHFLGNIITDIIMKRFCLHLLIMFAIVLPTTGQVDTSYIYNPNTPYGPLDIRLRKSASDYYYLDQGKTFSFRTENGQKTNKYLHLTSWDTEPYVQGQLREQFTSSSRFIMNYRLLLPEGFQANVKYPIVIFLHGLMETGNCNSYDCIHANKDYDPNINVPAAPTSPTSPLYNNDYNLLHGAKKYLAARNKAGNKLVGDPTLDPQGFPGFALFPQSNNEWSPSEVENAIRLLRLIVKKYNIDPNRIYINGLSRGGYGAFEAIKRAPWLFAAGIMFSPVSDANITTLDLVPSVRHIPIWIFQGGKDLLPTQKSTEDRIRNFRTNGMSVRYTLYPKLGHGTWNTGLSEPDFFSWLLGYTNSKIHGFGGGESLCSTSTAEALKLFLPPGYKEYEWQRNQQTVKLGAENFLVVQQVGNYRARFRFANTNQWNEWSKEIPVDAVAPAPASFTPLSTLHLPDLNNRNRTVLQANGEYDNYRWYRDDTLIDLPGDDDELVQIPTIEGTHGTGSYSLRVANFDGCYSPPSEKRKIFFNGESPVDLATPGNVVGTGKGPSEVEITWQDNSDGESGFEVWRRLSGDGYSPWDLATVTAPNIRSFVDSGLLPSTKYEYKVRAVSETGRSEYFPGSGTAAGVETLEDKTPPTRPTNMTAELADVNALKVQWESSTDNTSIKQYIVYINGIPMDTESADTTFWIKDLKVNTYYTIQVAAVDADNNIGPKSASVTINTEMTGLSYTHSTGSWLDLDSIDWTSYEYWGHVNDFDLSPKTQEDFFNFRFDGYLYIQNAGSYQFRITSNDGSRIMINGSLNVNNDGVHETLTVTGPPLPLTSGAQRITVDFFDFMGDDNILVEYMGPDTNELWKTIDAATLKSTGESATGELGITVYPNPGSNGITQVTINGGTGDPIIARITDSMGKQVREYLLDEGGSNHLTITDLNVQSGLYIIIVKQNDKVVSQRLVVIR